MRKLLFFLTFILIFGDLFSQKSVTIGNQVWMAENLNVDHFRNGDKISEAKTQEDWDAAGKNNKPVWCYYGFDPINGNKYGKLYNWYAVNDKRGLAPKGWRVSSETDWKTLSNFLGGDDVAGWKLKSPDSWSNYQGGNLHQSKMGRILHGRDSLISTGTNTNSSNFSAISGGSIGAGWDEEHGYWWCANQIDVLNAKAIRLIFHLGNIKIEDYLKSTGFSVRCVKVKIKKIKA